MLSYGYGLRINDEDRILNLDTQDFIQMQDILLLTCTILKVIPA